MEKCDKEKSCQYCTDRTPGCHSICEFYLRRVEQNEQKKQAIRKQKAMENMIDDAIIRSKQKLKKYRHTQRR